MKIHDFSIPRQTNLAKFYSVTEHRAFECRVRVAEVQVDRASLCAFLQFVARFWKISNISKPDSEHKFALQTCIPDNKIGTRMPE